MRPRVTLISDRGQLYLPADHFFLPAHRVNVPAGHFHSSWSHIREQGRGDRSPPEALYAG